MDVEKTMQFILDAQARTETTLERMGGDIRNLTVSEAKLAENMVRLTDLVQRIAETNHQEHERYDRLHKEADERYEKQRAANQEFHREVEERFNALIKMMDECSRNQNRRNGGPIQ